MTDRAEHADDVVVEFTEAVENKVRARLDWCQSPMEQMLLAELMQEAGFYFLPESAEYVLYKSKLKRVVGGWNAIGDPEAKVLVAQRGAGKYRLDFAIVPVDGSPGIAIEVDGHDYHERTKEQAKHDKRRDRWLQRHGWRALHFTGSEVFADPAKCALEVTAMADGDDT
jgi:hypothetical protein